MEENIRRLAEDLNRFVFDYDTYEYKDRNDADDPEDNIKDNVIILLSGDVDGVLHYLQKFVDESYDEEAVEKAKGLIIRVMEATPDGDWKKSYAKSPFPYHISSGIADSRKDGWFRVDPVLNQSETSKIEVRTENGTMVAEVSASSDYPGIWLYVTGKNGIDRTLALVEATDNGLVLRLYEKKNDENPTKSVPIEFPTMVAEVEMAEADFERVNRLLDIDDIESLEEDDYGAYLLEDGTAVEQNSRELLFSTEFDDGTKLDLYLCSGFTNYYTEPDIVKANGNYLTNSDMVGESLSENEEFVIDGIQYVVKIKLNEN